MQVFEEPGETIDRVSAATGQPSEYVRDVLRDVHFVIDSFVADDVNVLLPPLNFVRRGNPVVPAMVQHFRREDWEASEGLKTAEPDQLAKALGLPVAEVENHPCAFGIHVINGVCDWRGVPVNDLDAFDRVVIVTSAWRDDMQNHGVAYRISTPGLESMFEGWLVDNLKILAEAGIHLELEARQPRLDNGRRRPDLVCRLTEPLGDLSRGDLLVIENKTTPVGLKALAQVDEYADLVKAGMAGNRRRVGAMLIADGTTVELQRALVEAGVLYESLVSLGYREHQFRIGRLSSALDVAEGTATTLLDPAEVNLPDEFS